MPENTIQIVELTSSAINQIYRLASKESETNSNDFGLRLAIKGGGCSGLSYLLSFDSKQPKDLEQIYFKTEPGQETTQVKVFVDPKSAIYLKGMIVDFDDGLMGKGFVFKNPNATNTCGCGESFSVF
ncbi:MAG: iron-sulfur cluster assembly accessory protein [Cyanobacteriota bacterium]|jgi:iron-sulfur cluster assembly protein